MNKQISLSFASLFYAPASFYRDHAARDYQRLICDRSHVEALFHDDETINDGSSFFDAYAFNAWQEVQHDPDHREPETCDCHRYKRYCGICRPY